MEAKPTKSQKRRARRNRHKSDAISELPEPVLVEADDVEEDGSSSDDVKTDDGISDDEEDVDPLEAAWKSTDKDFLNQVAFPKGQYLKIPNDATVESVVTLQARGCCFKPTELAWWLSANPKHYEQVKHLIDLKSAFEEALKGDNMYVIQGLGALMPDLSPYKARFLQLQAESRQWMLREGFVQRCILRSMLKRLGWVGPSESVMPS